MDELKKTNAAPEANSPAPEQNILTTFGRLGITDYHVTEHEAIYHSDEAEEKGLILQGITPKNLLLRKKKTDRYYMVLTDYRMPADLKHFKELTGWGQVRFARDEEMEELLGVGTGAVSPLALVNDTAHHITVVLAADIAGAAGDTWINVHPGRNTATLSMRKSDLLRYLDALGCEVIADPGE